MALVWTWFYYSILTTLALTITLLGVDAVLTDYYRRKKARAESETPNPEELEDEDKSSHPNP